MHVIGGGTEPLQGNAKSIFLENNMKAVFINAMERKVEAVNIENELHTIYKQLGCDMIQCIDIGENHTLICDEEGRLRDWAMGFKLAGPTVIAGNALIVATTEDGDFADCQAPQCLFSRNVEFVDLKEHPLPPPKIGMAFIDGDLTEENIEKARAAAQRDLERQERE